jgi:sialate O-acetylesterase
MKIDNAEEEKESANYPEIRFFTSLTSTADVPQQLLTGEWVVCTPESMWNFSALMYFFGRELHQNLNVPLGLVHSSWGGTPIEVWIPEPIVRGDRWLNENADKLKPIPWGPHESGKAYNAMIHPLIPFKIKGALWYQGESNVDHPNQYARAMKTLIHSWRALWGYNFSFYYAQIAPYNGYGKDNVKGAIIRDQQRKVLDSTEKTGMAVLSDIGNLEDIHPGNKQDAGKRLAFWALHHDYGFTDMQYSGPLYKSFEMEKNKIIIHFDYSDGGLAAKDGDLKDFEILDEEGNWISATANIHENVVEVETKSFNSIKGIRFAFHNDSEPNLYNKAGLPASCFEILVEN